MWTKRCACATVAELLRASMVPRKEVVRDDPAREDKKLTITNLEAIADLGRENLQKLVAASWHERPR